MNIDALKKKIQEANPELGRVDQKHKYQTCSECMGYGYLVNPDGELSSDCFTCGGTCRERVEYLQVILGRPIRLADVLVAIYKKRQSNKTNITLESDGQFVQQVTYSADGRIEDVKKYLGPIWNLLDDNLDHQSEECLKFLTELLT